MGGRMLRLAAALVLAGGPAFGMTAEGTLITNLASATYITTAGVDKTISYGVTATVLVAQPTVALGKTASPTLQAVAGVVTFCITFSNTSRAASALNIQILDVLPTNMRFVTWASTDTWVNDPTAVVWPPDYAPTGGLPPLGWVNGTPVAGAGPTTTFRWRVPVLGPGKSGYVCYQASVI